MGSCPPSPTGLRLGTLTQPRWGRLGLRPCSPRVGRRCGQPWAWVRSPVGAGYAVAPESSPRTDHGWRGFHGWDRGRVPAFGLGARRPTFFAAENPAKTAAIGVSIICRRNSPRISSFRQFGHAPVQQSRPGLVQEICRYGFAERPVPAPEGPHHVPLPRSSRCRVFVASPVARAVL
jgi:hypothetical protein